MPLTSAEKMRIRREKLKREGKYEDYKKKVNEAVKKSRLAKKKQLTKMSSSNAKKIKNADREKNRKRVEKFRNKHKIINITLDIPTEQSAYNSNSALGKATAKVRRSLPDCEKKRKAVLEKLIKENGLDDVEKTVIKKSCSLALSSDIVTSVQEFYTRPDISREAPGLKDCIVIKNSSGEKEKVQVRHLFSSIAETYALFVEDNGKVIGKSKFAELRPKYVLLSNRLPHNTCLCRYHENFIMAVKAMNNIYPEFPQYDHQFVSKFTCDNETDECLLRKCDRCINLLRDKLNESGAGCESVDVTWHVWKDVDGKLSKVIECGSADDLKQYILGISTQYYEHCFVKRNQEIAYQIDKTAISSSDYPPYSAMVQIDFAENYICIAQDEIQSFHWAQPQITLWTMSMWFGGKQHPVVLVSDNRRHNKDTVIVYLERAMEELPENITEVHIWSDGPASQFKNKFIAAAMGVLEQKTNKKIIWNFFATSHGKGAVDGIGGSLKRFVRNIVLRREDVVFNAHQFAEVSEKSNVKTIEVTNEEIENRHTNMKLQEVFNAARNIPGISKAHIMFIENEQLYTSYISRTMNKSIKAL